MQQSWLTQHSTVWMKHGVMSMNTSRVPMGAWLAISLYLRNVPKDETRMTETCVVSSMTEIHVVGLKTGARSTSTLNRSSVKKGTITITVPFTINLTDSALLKEGAMQVESKLFSMT
jgi:hypothetical protein